MEYIVLGVIGIIAVGLLYYGIKKKKMEPFLNFVLRMTGGVLGIYLLNMILKSFGLNYLVGMNAYNLLTLGVLGTPGFIMLYGVSLYFGLKV